MGNPAPAPREALCDHCRTPVPAHLDFGDEEHRFCCAGCEAVFFAIRAHGLDRFYDLRELDDVPLPADEGTSVPPVPEPVQ